MESTRATRSLRSLFRVPERVPLQDRRFFVTTLLACVVGTSVHVIFIVFFLAVGIRVLWLFNILSVIAWWIGILLVYLRQRYVLAFTICCTELIVHQILCFLLVGWQAGFQYYLLHLAVMPFLLPRKNLVPSLVLSGASVAALALMAFFANSRSPVFLMPSTVLRIVSTVHITVVFVTICVSIYYFHSNVNTAEEKATKEHERAENLLHNILPRGVAEELSATGSSRPIRVDSATILFSDFVHFTRSTHGIDPVSIVAILNGYFTAFDLIARRYNVERLKTIGDGYMCAGGIPGRNTTHPIDVCMTALAMLRHVVESLATQEGSALDIRIGINTGPVTAGIVGSTKFSYDIWGESVNTASRHESSGVEGGINVSKGTFLLTKGLFDFHARGEIEVKGGEKMEMYELRRLKEKYGSMEQPNALYRETYGRIARGEVLLGYDL